jgi:hypothetical protein
MRIDVEIVDPRAIWTLPEPLRQGITERRRMANLVLISSFDEGDPELGKAQRLRGIDETRELAVTGK